MGDYALFQCDCGWRRLVEYDPVLEDLTTSTGCCPACGGRKWGIYETGLTKKKVFERKLSGYPDPYFVGAIGKQIV